MRGRHAVVMRLVLLLSLVVAAGCAPDAPPTREPDIIGLITVAPVDGRTILVEERPHEVAGSAKASLRITADTRIWRAGNGIARASASDLVVGVAVHAWITGPVRESYPIQADASDVMIDPSAARSALYALSKGAAEVTIRVNGVDRGRLPCNGGVAIQPGADGMPALPWQLTVVRPSDGRVLLDDRVTALPRWLLVQGESAGISTAPISGPFVPCP